MIALTALILAAGLAPVPAPRAATLRECAAQLADGLVASLGRREGKIAVTAFVKLGEGETLLGGQLADELDGALFRTGRRITLIERRRLAAAVDELRLSAGDVFEPANARRVGQFLGAEAVVVGSIYAADGLNVVARVVRVETADVLAAAECVLEPAPVYLTAFAAAAPRAPAQPAARGAAAPEAPAAADGIVFQEDFSRLKEGTAPPSWLGTEHFGVVFEKRGATVFRAFEPGAGRFTIPGLKLPAGDFAIEWIVSREPGWCASQPNWTITLGNLQAGAEHTGCGHYQARLNNSTAGLAVSASSPHRFELRREGVIFTLWMDGTRLLLVRKTDFQGGDTLVLDFDAGHDNVNAGTLYGVTVRER